VQIILVIKINEGTKFRKSNRIAVTFDFDYRNRIELPIIETSLVVEKEYGLTVSVMFCLIN
jgi:hypothetical protein